MLRVVADIRGAALNYFTYDGKPITDNKIGIPGALKIVNALKILPIYLAFRADNPLAAKGEIPPALIALANSAAGTAGAVGGFISTNMGNPEKLMGETTAEDFIDDAEARGNMVGENTVCAAKPAMMKNFLNAIFHGPNVPERATLDIWEYISPEEIPALFQFSHSFGFCNDALQPLKKTDERLSAKVREIQARGQSDKRRAKRIKKIISIYFLEQHAIFTGVTVHQMLLNDALGRERGSQPLSMESYEQELELEMPSILRGLERSAIPKALASGPVHFHVQDFDPTMSVWDVLGKLLNEHPEVADI